MENSKKKERIKDIAIVFLIIMLLLTLFSNTIMNRSLVEVSTARIEDGTLVSKVRGSGVVESADGYNVSISEVRKIATINVHEGDEVSTGDILFTLEDAESDELIAKREEVAKAEREYAKSALDSVLSLDQRKAVEAGKGTSLTAMQTNLQAAKDAVTSAQAEVDKIAANFSEYSYTNYDAIATAEKNLAAAESEARPYLDALTAAKTAMTTAQTAYLADTSDATKKSAYDSAYNTYLVAYYAAIPYQNKVDAADAALTSAKSEVSVTLANDSSYKAATAKVTSAQTAYDNLKAQYDAELALEESYDSLKSEREALAKLEKNAVGAEVTSPINGTVSSIALTAGMKTTAEEAVMVLQPENMGYTLSFTATATQAKKIAVGDEATVVNNWWGDDVHAQVKQIKKSATDKNNVTVVCELSGDDVQVGSNYTLSVGEKSASYDLIVPTSSIREDSNGKYILWIESKSTPLGNRYYARRADVEILASDDTNSAISAQVDAYEYVITTTTKPVEENQQVRLAD